MSEWWTYRPSDFLMFSPRIYWRLFQALNEAWWPAQAVLLAAGVGWIGWIGLQARKARADIDLRGAALCLAACWVVVAWAFLLQRFAPINWVATGFAAAFVLQGLGLVVLALLGGLRGENRVVRRRAGIALGLWALLGHPLLSAAFERPWQQAEVFGLAPDPTAIGSLAFLLLVSTNALKVRWLLRALWIVPLGWCAISAATLATMGSAQAWVVLAAALLAATASTRH